jgi:hypothetical protein
MRLSCRFALHAALLALLVACGGAPPSAARPDPDARTPRRLYPLREGNVWSYKVDTGTNLDSLVVMRVVRAENGHFEVSPGGGGSPNVYELRPEGLFRPGNGTWLLRAPLEAGASWPSASGMTATVTSIAARAATGAGEFTDCVEITEEGGDGGRTIRTVYCPDVGPVLIDTSMALTTSETPMRVVARLQGYAFGGE